VSAEEEAGYLLIRIQDNGKGYPKQIIDTLNNHQRGIDFNSGSTNLGLYFAQAIAKLHQLKERSGSISISNNETGGCFELKLP
jgi:signal transduction histidine kinase